MEEKKDKAEWLIRPRVRKLAGVLAGVAAYTCPALAGLNVLVPVLIYAGCPDAAAIVWEATNDLFCLWVALLAVLVPWCHCVLLAERGSYFTRLFCELAVLPAAFVAIGTVSARLTGEPLLGYQMDLPFFMSLMWFIFFLFNINNMAAAPLRLTILSALGLLLLTGAASVVGFYELMVPDTILQIAACAALFHPLRLLQAAAPRIISLPPQPPGA